MAVVARGTLRRFKTAAVGRSDELAGEAPVRGGLESRQPIPLAGLTQLAGQSGTEQPRRRGQGQLPLASGAPAGERPPHRQREPGVLDVDEEGPPVGGERRAGELPQAVAGERVQRPLGGDADDAVATLLLDLVLGEPQVAPWRDGQVVGILSPSLSQARGGSGAVADARRYWRGRLLPAVMLTGRTQKLLENRLNARLLWHTSKTHR